MRVKYLVLILIFCLNFMPTPVLADMPTLTSFITFIDTVNEDTEVEITLEKLKAQGDEADADGTVDAFVVQEVSTGILRIGTNSNEATVYEVTANDVIDATHNAYWTPALNDNGLINSFTVKAKDNESNLSNIAIQTTVNVNPVNDAPFLRTLSIENLYQFNGNNSEDYFGISVHSAGDVNNDGYDDVIVGAHWAPDSSRKGRAYVYSGNDGILLYQFNGIEVFDYFGYSVSTAGDVNNDGFDDVIVGAYGANNNGNTSSGSAYIYSGINGTVLYQFDGFKSEDRFGHSVSDAGDVNNDGFDDVIIGVYGADPDAKSGAGSAYIYSGRNGVVLYQFDGSFSEDYFGYTVNKAGDVNNDGFDDVIVGAHLADPNGKAEAGSAYIYSGINGNLLYQFDGESIDDRFGESVSSAGDVNNDGFDDVIVGAHLADPNGKAEAGSAYIYSGINGNLLYQFDGSKEDDRFGYSVGEAGDINSDGFADLIIGAYRADPNEKSEAGSAFLYSGKNGFILYQFDGTSTDDRFGISVSNVPNINDDSKYKLIIGAYQASPNNKSLAGSATIYTVKNLKFNLIDINEDVLDINNTGISVSELLQSNNSTISDIENNVFGIAITNIVNTNGIWQYSIDNGVNWLNINDASPANNSALLLTENDKIRFVPAKNQYGLDNGSIIFKAWDKTIGVSGDVNADTTVSTAWSENTGTAKITVNAVNDTPSINDIANPVAINEDASEQIINLIGINSGVISGSGIENQTLTITATSNNTNLIPNPIVTYTSPETMGTLKYSPVADASGSAVITVGVTDDGVGNLFVEKQFTVTVNPVNDAPILRTSFNFSTSVELYRFNGENSKDYLGRSVSNAGDVNNDGYDDVIIGAFGADNNGNNSGSAYVYSGNGVGLLYQFDGEVAYDCFGCSVSGAGDVNNDGYDDVIIGAYFSDINASGSGSAYVYSGNGGSLLYQFNGTSIDARFGNSVSGAGDVNNDGYDDVIVGAYNADNNGISSGSAYVYSGNDGGLLYQFDGILTGDSLGNSVSDAGDVNNDGYDDIIIGAPKADNNGISSGSAYVYSGNDGGLLYQFDGANAEDWLGHSVCGAGDINNDGYVDIIVGSFNADPNGKADAGSVYVYSGKSGDLLYQFDGALTGDNFGYSVSGAGDINNDGYVDIIIGSFNADPNGKADAGSVYIYSGKSGDLLYQFDGLSAGDSFGWSVSNAGDINNDGIIDILVGAIYAGDNDSKSGSATIYTFEPENFKFSLTDINEDILDVNNTGTLVSEIVQSSNLTITDSEQTTFGLAITGVTNENGIWQYSIDNGSNWLSLADITPANNSALLLTENDKIRFVPAKNQYGLDNGSIIFKAWDKTIGVSGDVNADTTVSTAWSENTGTAKITVNAVNDTPSINDIANPVIINEDASEQIINLTGINSGVISGSGIENQTLTITATSNNTNLIPNPTITYTSPDTTGTLKYTPVANASGSAVIIVRVTDDGDGNLFIEKQFTVTVNPVNDAPFMYSPLAANNAHQFNGQDAGDCFGRSVSAAGDVNNDGYEDVIIGADYADPDNKTNAGSAYIYSGIDYTPLYQFNGESAGDRFGYSVSGAGDVNNDGYADVIIGAQDADPNSNTSSGSAYIYSGVDGSLLYRFDGSVRMDYLGYSVSGAGDINNDGYADFIIGAYGAGSFGNSPGAAYIHSGIDGTLLYQFNGNVKNDSFGYSVSNAGDVNNDGYADVIIGAPGTDPGEIKNAGRVYIYSGIDGVLLYQFDGIDTEDLFGDSVSDAGDVNNDGYADIIIGASRANPNAKNNAGSVYVYSGIDGSLLYNFDGAEGDRFGISVSAAGDVNSDGFDDFTLSAITDINDERNGGVFIYSGDKGVLLHQFNGVDGNYNFGLSVSNTGDKNKDGFSDIIIGGLTGPNGDAYIYSFNDGKISLNLIEEDIDDASNSGTVISEIIESSNLTVLDSEQTTLGMAITGVTNENGIWQYSIDNGSNWLSLADITPANNSALLLAEDDKLRFLPSANQYGVDNGSITFKAWDKTIGASGDTAIDTTLGTAWSETSAIAQITVNGVNDIPTLNDIANPVAIDEDAGEQIINLIGIGSGVISGSGIENQTLTITATSNNTNLIPNPTITYTSPDTTGTLKYTPVENANGTTVITMRVTDDGTGNLFVEKHFTVVVNPVNDAPKINSCFEPFKSKLLYQFDGEFYGDRLGKQVSNAGDVNNDGYDDVIIGNSWADPNNKTSAGSAYIYSGYNGTLLYQFDGELEGDVLGRLVSSAGNINNDGYDDFIIGTCTDDINGNKIGCINIYSGKKGDLLYQFKSTSIDNSFGNSVSNAGDVNNDGYDDIIIGDSYSDSNGIDSGSAYIYSGKTGSLLYQFDGMEIYDSFGEAVSNAGDVDNDGYADVIIGAPWANYVGGSRLGGAYVYSGKTGDLLYQFAGQASLCSFGESVSNAGDVNNDGYADVIIGAPGTDIPHKDLAGSAYIYSGEDGTLLYQFNGQVSLDCFGNSVSNAGDINNDGYADVIIGAWNADSNDHLNNGSAYIYSGKNGELLNQLNGEDGFDNFGKSVSNAGDVNSDGCADVIIGAFHVDTDIPIVGRVYVYSFNAGNFKINSIDEDIDDASNSGTLVSEIIEFENSTITDPEQTTLGMAITGVTDTNGIWQYSIDNGSNWLSLADITPANNSALLLAEDDKLRFLPNANQYGVDNGSITFKVWDKTIGASGNIAIDTTLGNAWSATSAIAQITINVVNDTPILNDIANPVVIDKDAGEQIVNLTGIGSGVTSGAGIENQTLTITATSNNTNLIPNPTITYTSPETLGTLKYTPVADASGLAVITVRVTDDGVENLFVEKQFTVVVNSGPDAPNFITPLDAIDIRHNPILSLTTYNDDNNKTHKSTIWELYNNSTFSATALVWSSIEDTINLTAITVDENSGIFSNALLNQNHLSTNTQYWARARYKNDSNEYGGWTPVKLFTTANTIIPSEPPEFLAQSEDKKIILTWQKQDEADGCEIDSYRLYRSLIKNDPNPDLIAEFENNIFTYEDTGLFNNTTYMYWIKAVNKAGESTFLTELTAIPHDSPHIKNLSIADLAPVIKIKSMDSTIVKGNCKISWEAFDSDSSFEVRLYYSSQILQTPTRGDITTYTFPINMVPLLNSDKSNKFIPKYYDWDVASFINNTAISQSLLVDGTNRSIPLYIYAMAFDGIREPSSENQQIVISQTSLIIEKVDSDSNQAPVFEFNSPGENNITADSSATIDFTLKDDGSDSIKVKFYYSDMDDSDVQLACYADQIKIEKNILPSNEIQTIKWDTLTIPDGKYYIHALIYDGINQPEMKKSKSLIIVKHALSNDETMPEATWINPSFENPMTDITGVVGISLEVQDFDGDSLEITFYYNTLPSEDFNLVQFAGPVLSDNSTVKKVITTTFDTTLMDAGQYYLLAKIKQIDVNLPSLRVWTHSPVYVGEDIVVKNMRITNMRMNKENRDQAEIKLSLLTDIETSITIQYGSNIWINQSKISEKISKIHLLSLSSLNFDTLYYYKIIVTANNKQLILDNLGDLYTFIVPSNVKGQPNIEKKKRVLKGKIKGKPNTLVHVYLDKKIAISEKPINLLSDSNSLISQAITTMTDQNGEWMVDLGDAVTMSGDPIDVDDNDKVKVEAIDETGQMEYIENVSIKNISGATTELQALMPIELGGESDGISFTGETIEYQLNLVKGFNLVAPPLEPVPALKAEWILKNVSNSSAVYYYSANSSKYLSLIKFGTGAEDYLGDNFEIDVTKGFFIKMAEAGTINLVGKKLMNSRPITFLKGFNMISLAYGKNFPAHLQTDHSAMSLLKKIGKNAIAIYKYNSMSYQSFIRIDNTGDDTKDYLGENFEILQGEGYFIKLNKDSAIIP